MGFPRNSWLLPPDSSGAGQDLARLEAKVDDLLAAIETPVAAPSPPPAGLLSYWRTLKAHTALLVVAAVVPAVVGWFIAFHEQKIYQARSTMELLEPGRTLNMRNLSNNNRMFDGDTYMETQVAKLKSKSLLKTVRRQLLQEGVDTGTPAASKSGSAETAIQQIRSNLEIAPIRGTSLIEVTYDSPDPKLAARFINTLTSQYIRSDVEARAENAEQTRDWLQKELEDAKAKLETSERRLQAYANSSGLLYTSPKGNAGEEAENKLQFIAQELGEVQAKRATLQARYDVAASSSPNAQVSADQSEALHGIQARLLDLRRDRASLASQFTPEYYKLQEVNAEIAELEARQKNEYTRWLVKLREEYETEKRHEDLVEAAYRQQASLVSDQAGKAIHYNVLKREVETNRNLYDSLLGGMKEAGVNAAAKVSNARVVDTATAPLRPYRPNPIRNSAIGLFGGLVVGIAFVLFNEASDRRLRSPGTAPSYLNVPELGVIPSVSPNLLPTAHRERDGAVTLHRRLRSRLRRGPERAGPVADAFHATVTSIFLSGRYPEPPQVVVIASATAHEGKSTVTGNLGLMAAQVGKRVLLIDGDLRNPQLHRTYAVSNERGLTELLLGQGPLGEREAYGMVVPTHRERLFLLPGGQGSSDLISLLHSGRMAEALNQLRTEFDLILIDTPPVLPFADARVFGKLADAVVLVVRAGHTSRNLAMAAKVRFIDDGLPVIGTILNGWDGREGVYEYDETTYR